MDSIERDLLLQHRAKHLLAHVLVAAGARRWPAAMRGESGETATGFYADFELAEAPGEADLAALTDEMARLLGEAGGLRRRSLPAAQAQRVFADQPWKQQEAAAFAELGEEVPCYELGGVLDVCACALRHGEALRALHPERFVLTGAGLVAWVHRGRTRWLVRVRGELFPAVAACACCAS